MILNTRIFVILGVIAVAAILMVQAVHAAPGKSNTRPGWGYGDKHHIHTGPPGQSVRPGDGDNDHDDQGGHDH